MTLLGALGGCGDSKQEPPYPYTLDDLESAFTEASVPYVRQTKGPFRVGTDDRLGCEELHSPNYRMSAVVCSRSDSSFMLLHVFPEDDDAPKFDNANALVAYLAANRERQERESVLVVDDGNLTISYVGGDIEMARALAQAIRTLQSS